MKEFVKIIKEHNYRPAMIADIGSYNGKDLQILMNEFNCKGIAIEAHPKMIPHIIKRGLFCLNRIVSDFNGASEFHAVDLNANINHGTSTVFPTTKPHTTVKVKTIRMDSLDANPDVAKIDTEGNSYQVLSGFGDRLKDVGFIHVEVEEKEIWPGQKLRKDVEGLLKKHFIIEKVIPIGDSGQFDLICVNKKIKDQFKKEEKKEAKND